MLRAAKDLREAILPGSVRAKTHRSALILRHALAFAQPAQISTGPLDPPLCTKVETCPSFRVVEGSRPVLEVGARSLADARALHWATNPLLRAADGARSLRFGRDDGMADPYFHGRMTERERPNSGRFGSSGQALLAGDAFRATGSGRGTKKSKNQQSRTGLAFHLGSVLFSASRR
jgi:hypothetical protein